MASIPYDEILKRLERLGPGELWLLLGEVQTRIRTQPKVSLDAFEPTPPLDEKREDWVGKLREEWHDEAS